MLLQASGIPHAYFFFFGFFFLTPPPDAAPVAAEANSAAVSGVADADSAPAVATAVGCWTGLRFCIFCMSERLRASKRLRNTLE